jgi:hypothetical protein
MCVRVEPRNWLRELAAELDDKAKFFAHTFLLRSDSLRAFKPTPSTRPINIDPGQSPAHPTIVPLDPALRTIFRRPCASKPHDPAFFSLHHPNVGRAWFLGTAVGPFIFCEHFSAMLPLGRPATLVGGKLAIGSREFELTKGHTAAGLAERYLSGAPARPLEFVADCLVLQERPPICYDSWQFYLPITSDLCFLYAVTRMPMPGANADGFFDAWIAACGSRLKTMWPVVVHEQIMLPRQTFVRVLIQLSFLKEMEFVNIVKKFAPRNPGMVMDFFRELEQIEVSPLVRWLFSIVMEAANQSSNAVYFTFADFLFDDVIQPIVLGVNPDVEAGLAFTRQSLRLSPNVSPVTIAAMKRSVDAFVGRPRVKFDELVGPSFDDVRNLITVAFARPAQFRTAVLGPGLDAAKAAYTARQAKLATAPARDWVRPLPSPHVVARAELVG